jgi:CysZ protein
MGFDHFLIGFRLLTKRDIRIWVLIPLFINIFLFVAVGFVALQYLNGLWQGISNNLPDWLDFIAWLILPLFGIFLLIVYGYAFTTIANLIAAPFYGLLCERTQNYLKADADNNKPLTWAEVGAIAWQSLVRELNKLRYFLPRIILVVIICVVLSFIPILNLLSPFIGFLWGAWAMSLQYLDYPAENNGVSFEQVRQQAKGKKSLLFGFGALVLLAMSIPLVNLLVLPAAVTGATSLWLAEMSKDSSGSV